MLAEPYICEACGESIVCRPSDPDATVCPYCDGRMVPDDNYDGGE